MSNHTQDEDISSDTEDCEWFVGTPVSNNPNPTRTLIYANGIKLHFYNTDDCNAVKAWLFANGIEPTTYVGKRH